MRVLKLPPEPYAIARLSWDLAVAADIVAAYRLGWVGERRPLRRSAVAAG